MIDLHCHLLPGVDDGPEELSIAAAMCRAAAQDGCTVLVATPHQQHPLWLNDDSRVLERKRRELQAAVGTSPRIALGSEIRVNSDFFDVLDSLSHAPRVLPLAASRYLLLEFASEGVGPQPETVVHETVIAGWRPVLAHVEFLPWLCRDLAVMGRLAAAGALLQVNAGSLRGGSGRLARDAGLKLLDADLVHIVASDCHDLRHRPPGLGEARRFLAKRYGEARAHTLLTENPRAIVDNRMIEQAA